MRKDKDPLQSARRYAFLLLKFRLRSEAELNRRLRQKGFNQDTAQETIRFLKEKRFLDDMAFARSWCAMRLERPFGLRRIKQELKIKGIKEEAIDSLFKEIKNNYREEGIVKKIIQEKFDRVKDTDKTATKRRIYAYLVRRGFSPEVISDSLDELCRHTF